MNKISVNHYTPLLRRFAPPGYEVEREVKIFYICVVASLLYSFGFFVQYFMAYWDCHNYLYVEDFSFLLLNREALMPDFIKILRYWLIGFILTSFVMLAYVPLHYVQYYQESKSIYVMRRLRNPFELHVRCWAVPVFCAVCSIFVAFVILVLYFGIYMLATPEECLTPDQWLKIWRAMS